MRRLLLAAGLALGAHGLLLAAGGDWLQRSIPEASPRQVVTVTLDAVRKPSPAKVEKELSRPPKPEPVTKAAGEKTPAPKRKIQKIVPRHPVHRPPKEKPQKREPVPAPVKRAEAKPSEPAPRPSVEQPSRPATDLHQELAVSSGRPSTEEPEPVSQDKAADTASSGAAHQETVLARPLYQLNPPPRYPIMARRRRYQGMVLLDVLVDARGRAKDLRV
ncbi:MAG: energy transducer TonB, partial [Deltaproteobacteria bacterium]